MRTLTALALLIASCLACVAQSQPQRYENKDFTLSFPIPDGWTVADDGAKEAYAKAAKLNQSQHLLLLLTRNQNDGPAERITLLAERFENGVRPSVDAAIRYVDTWAAAHPNFERDLSVKAREYDIDGVGRFKSKDTPTRWVEIYATIHLSDFFRVAGEFNSENSLKQSLRFLHDLKITPDWVNPKEKVSSDDVDPEAADVEEDGKLHEQVGTPGFLIKKVQPEYPRMARNARVEGTVVFRGVINKNGKIAELTILTGDPLLVRSAMNAVRQWEYRPYLLRGKAVDVETLIRVNYKLR